MGQEPILFNETIKENMLLGHPSATDDEIEHALEKANAMAFLRKKSGNLGINMHVGGSQLSGGQKQRVAIARAFIKKPKILLFDEATSALDKRNEVKVQSSIDALKKDLGQVTTLVIAHRLSTIRNADNILVMKKGRIVEQGNHEELLKNFPNGTYAMLVKQQESAEKGDSENASPIRKEEIGLDETIKSGEYREPKSEMNSPDMKAYITGKDRNHLGQDMQIVPLNIPSSAIDPTKTASDTKVLKKVKIDKAKLKLEEEEMMRTIDEHEK